MPFGMTFLTQPPYFQRVVVIIVVRFASVLPAFFAGEPSYITQLNPLSHRSVSLHDLWICTAISPLIGCMFWAVFSIIFSSIFFIRVVAFSRNLISVHFVFFSPLT